MVEAKRTEQPHKERNKTENNFSIKLTQLFDDVNFREHLVNDTLPNYIISQRWYGGKSSSIKYIEIASVQSFVMQDMCAYGLVIEVYFKEAFSHTYFLPLAAIKDDLSLPERAVIEHIEIEGEQVTLVDAIYLEEFRRTLFKMIQKNQVLNEDKSDLVFKRGSFLNKKEEFESSRVINGEQSNTSFFINDKYILKIYRRLFDRTNPDYEISYYLTERAHYKNSPQYAGSITWQRHKDYNISIGLMQEAIHNIGDAWEYTLPYMENFFNNCIDRKINPNRLPKKALFNTISMDDVPRQLYDLFRLDMLDRVDLLAQRTAELHVALGSEKQDLAFTPSTYNSDFSVWLKNRLIYQFENRINLLENSLYKIEGVSLDYAKQFLEGRRSIRYHFLSFDETKLKGQRIRIHGDYHLGQILVTNDDFYIIDFEGEPESTIRDRKVKQTPLKDVAGILRSFHYAIYSTIFNNYEQWNKDLHYLFDLGEWLYSYLVGVFMHRYINIVQDNNLNIGYSSEILYLLKYNMLEKAVYELGYELNARPNWTVIPLKGISQIIKTLNIDE